MVPSQSSTGAPGRARRKLPWRALSLVAVHLAVLAHLAHWRVQGVTLTPLEPSEAMQTLELGWVNAGFVLLAVTLLLTLVVGRFFCGWACHVVAYQDLCAALLRRLGLAPRPVRMRTLVALPFVVAGLMFVLPTLERIASGAPLPSLEVRMTTEAFWKTFPGPFVATLTLLVDGFLVVVWLGSKGFCTYGCPYGALFAIGDRFAPGRIRVDDACDGSAVCTSVCTSNVRVHEEVARFGMVVDHACLKCMDCVRACPNGALRVGFGPAPGLRTRLAPRRTYDFTWGEEAFAVVLCVGALLAFRGLAHAVPLLLAVGLAVLVAIAGLVLLRALRTAEWTFQHVVVKRAGAFTRAGRWLGAGCLALLAFTLHAASVRLCAELGERSFVRIGTLSGAARAQEIARAERWLERADRIGVLPDGALDSQLGSLAAQRGDFVGAEARFTRATRRAPELDHAWLGLAEAKVRRGARAEAAEVLRTVLARSPGFTPARDALRKLEAR